MSDAALTIYLGGTVFLLGWLFWMGRGAGPGVHRDMLGFYVFAALAWPFLAVPLLIGWPLYLLAKRLGWHRN